MKTPRPPEGNQSVPNSAKFTHREARVVASLLTSNWFSRESIDRIAGASNGPQIIAQIRRKATGHDGIEMQRIDAIDRDGRPCKPGQYRLNEIGRQRLADWKGAAQ